LQEENQQGDFKIEKDLSRTIPGHVEFTVKSSSGNNRLFNVLKAY